jgi:hypothetical protein
MFISRGTFFHFWPSFIHSQQSFRTPNSTARCPVAPCFSNSAGQQTPDKQLGSMWIARATRNGDPEEF